MSGETYRSTPAFAIGGDTQRRGDVLRLSDIPPFVCIPLAAAEGWARTAERVLAAQGDGAEPELVKLQHDLAREIGAARRIGPMQVRISNT